MATVPLCPACQGQLRGQADAPHDQLTEFASHEATTVDGGFSEHEYRCKDCGHILQHLHGIAAEGWTEIR